MTCLPDAVASARCWQGWSARVCLLWITTGRQNPLLEPAVSGQLCPSLTPPTKKTFILILDIPISIFPLVKMTSRFPAASLVRLAKDLGCKSVEGLRSYRFLPSEIHLLSSKFLERLSLFLYCSCACSICGNRFFSDLRPSLRCAVGVVFWRNGPRKQSLSVPLTLVCILFFLSVAFDMKPPCHCYHYQAPIFTQLFRI